jgi:hypothetical protein
MSEPRRRLIRTAVVAVNVVPAVGGFVLWRTRGHGGATESGSPAARRPSLARGAGSAARDEAPGGVVEGRVVDPGGRPVSVAAVTAIRQFKREGSPRCSRRGVYYDR